ncbi:glycosyltransferase-like protein LARGE [Clonorchis sinensis]|uniref:Glycosyltransferase-like protein LARGE n=1 Tax=Clonorchis sinensis TaxID=79923 RepID=G7YS89_CLOSI|nr:glycosyltransferase-like protein LARGE [Clonorchis sinensis]
MLWRKARKNKLQRRFSQVLLLLLLTAFIFVLRDGSLLLKGCTENAESEQSAEPPWLSSELGKNDDRLEKIDGSLPIQLALVVGGAQAARQTSTLLKSIVYFAQWTYNCSGRNRSHDRNKQKVSGDNSRFPQLHLHMIVDRHAFISLNSLLQTWELPGVQFSLYSVHDYENEVSWIPTTHYSGTFGLCKLLLPNILPPTVEKVIGLDVDLLLNADIRELWDCFDRFTHSQMIGLVRNQSPWYLQGAQNTVWPALGYGYNTGVMLLHLQRMKLMRWKEAWQSVAKSTLQYLPHAPLADQDVINALLVQMPDAVNELACEWNVQLNSRAQPMQCPVHWLTVQKPSPDNINSHIGQLKIAHYNSPVKPELMNQAFSAEDESSPGDIGLRLRTNFVQQYRFFQNFDGVILKHQVRERRSEECEDHETDEAQAPLAGECSELIAQVQIHHRIHPFYMHCEIQPKAVPTKCAEGCVVDQDADVTLVSQLTFDRIHRVEEIAKRWEGPMSLALYVTDRDAAVLVDFVSRSQLLVNRTNIGYHLVYVDGVLYPINKLRNVAMQFAQTKFLFILDVDFIPSPNMYRELKTIIERQLRGPNKETRTERWCLVVPAFETFGEHVQLPETKDALLAQWAQNSVVPFRHEIWTAGHMATDYERWKNTSDLYEVFWSADYEPYIVIPRNVLQFDEHFVGFGWNKASFVMALDALGYRFLVLPNAFILHLPHPPSIEVLRFRSDSVYRSCVDKIKLDYITQLARKHGVRALKYLDFRKDTINP